MSQTAIFFIGLFVTALCIAFVGFTIVEVRRLYAEADRSGAAAKSGAAAESDRQRETDPR